MKINDVHYRTLWLNEDGWSINTFDQTQLPHEVQIIQLRILADAATAITTMQVRGAPLIGATAAYGMALAARENPSDTALEQAYRVLYKTRPTAVNLRWALDAMHTLLAPLPANQRASAAYQRAGEICDQDVAICAAIGQHGLRLIRDIAKRKPKGEPVNILTHCNAGWLATLDWGTATAPIYQAHAAGIAVHVWVDETRPRSQGLLTAFELGQHGVPHTYIVDNTGGHLMQHGLVDLCIVGTDRTTADGDVANKIGTYLKALAAKDNQVPFYVALPSTTIDWTVHNGITEIPIEQRSSREVYEVIGQDATGKITPVHITPDTTAVANYAFDVTPARLITGLITERGIAKASRVGLAALFPEHSRTQTPSVKH